MVKLEIPIFLKQFIHKWNLFSILVPWTLNTIIPFLVAFQYQNIQGYSNKNFVLRTQGNTYTAMLLHWLTDIFPKGYIV